MSASQDIVVRVQSEHIFREDNRTLASSPSSTASDCLSGDDSYMGDRETIPPSLIEDELQLALHKDAGIEELENAVARCRELVLESEQCSTERKWLVRHLIELRLRQQECRDALTDPTHPRNKGSSVNKRVILGHHLILQPFLNVATLSGVRKTHCDQCAGTIWSMLQAWYQCTDCTYSCHHTCIPHIVRICAHLTATERGKYINDICPEKGISAQRYQCAECKTPLTFRSSGWAEARLCDYDGCYYCTACHWNSTAVIPARVVHNWDMDKHSVCQASAQLLKITAKQPLIYLEQLNPKLFTFISELSFVKKLREELLLMKKYLSVCRVAQSQHLLWKLGDRHHLIDTSVMYSLQDLMDIHVGELPTFLQAVSECWANHVTLECAVCRGRGHLCEACGNDEVIFPFMAAVMTCTSCSAVFHRICWTRKKQTCVRCARLKKRSILLEEVPVEDRGTDQDSLLQRHSMPSLISRRESYSARFLWMLLHNKIDAPYLLSCVPLYVPRITARYSQAFYLPKSHTDILQRSPIYVLCRNAELYFDDIFL